ncbi:MAG: hypothetical protein IT567_04000 [Alphaproteobacteria bacterium]|nr:hypothetical protein [Alphaproteobacteria bacterium]
MPLISIAAHRRPILTFEAGELSFSQDSADILLSAQGEMRALDTDALLDVQHSAAACTVTITKDDGSTALDALFHVHFFEVESTMLIIRLEGR